jgi:hypothetical protein
MRRALRRLVLPALALGVGCAPAPSEPCPTDAALIARFEANEAGFEKLLAEPGNASLRAQLGVRDVHPRGEGFVLFTAWYLDFPGPGGVAKGYAYSREPLDKLVDSIDASSDPGSAEVKDLYRRVQGSWYLYYSSSH